MCVRFIVTLERPGVFISKLVLLSLPASIITLWTGVLSLCLSEKGKRVSSLQGATTARRCFMCK